MKNNPIYLKKNRRLIETNSPTNNKKIFRLKNRGISKRKWKNKNALIALK
jgi:hypothetical protein